MNLPGLLPCALWALASPIGLPEMVPLDVPLESAGFEHIGWEQGVAVYQQTDTELIHIAAEGRLEASPDRVREVLLDYERHVGRVERVDECRVLTRDPDHLIVYQRLSLPVISDRDFYLDVRWGRQDEIRWIHYRTCLAGAPERPGVVRVLHHLGSWQLKPAGAGEVTWARYQSNIDLAGMLPRGLARSSAGDEVPGLFVAIRRMLAECDPAGR